MTGTWIKVARLSANALFTSPLLPIITVRWLRDSNIGLTGYVQGCAHADRIDRERPIISVMDRPIDQVSVGIRPFQIGLQLDCLGGRHGARREQHRKPQSGEAD